MKKLSIIVLLILSGIETSFGQMAGELFTGTIKPGTTTSAVIAIRSSATFTGQFTNLQFTIQVPNTITPQPVVTIKSNPLSAFIPSGNYSTQITDEGGYFNYLFAATVTGSPVYSFAAGTEIDALEVDFAGANGQTADIRLAQVPNGGTTSQLNFYVEVSGNDNTNATAPFYGTGAVNSALPAYTGYSYVPLANVLLPITLTNFSASKKDRDAILKWQVENQDPTSAYFEMERSFTGTDFKKIGRLEVNLSYGSSASYSFADVDIGSLKLNGVIFYRLRLVDKDGKFSYSDVQTVRVGQTSLGYNIFPNPAKSFITASIQLDENKKVFVTISDAAGKTAQKFEFNGIAGLNQRQIDLSKIPRGYYVLKIRAGDSMQTTSFFKE